MKLIEAFGKGTGEWVNAYEVHYPSDIDFSPLDDFGTPAWGCTGIKHNGKWV